jgi:hypothetical protein
MESTQTTVSERASSLGVLKLFALIKNRKHLHCGQESHTHWIKDSSLSSLHPPNFSDLWVDTLYGNSTLLIVLSSLTAVIYR